MKEIGKCNMVLHKSSKPTLPLWTRLKPRTRSDVTIWSLPDDVLLILLKRMHIRDLLSMRSVHSHFRDLIDANVSLLTNASFQDTWPSLPNINKFEMAANHGNIEALIKLGIAYLYNEGFPGDFEGKKIMSNGEKAAEMFCAVETLTPEISPFTWLFIRPPWSNAGTCCKERVFSNMKTFCDKEQSVPVQLCLAHILQLFEDESKQQEAVTYLEKAASQGSTQAAYHLWQQQQKSKVHDVASELQSLRSLRDIASLGKEDSKLALCNAYTAGKYGGISQSQAAAFVREFVQSSKPTFTGDVFMNNVELTPSMRYILVDWLVEVATMKDFNSLTLHVAISVVDRYLKRHSTSRSRLQLLGVAAMVVCSRFLGKDIITIREAAWLTDNTYKYEDVVRMMGEITATLKGDIRVTTSYDYVQVLGRLASLDGRTQCLAEYICEMALLHIDLSAYTPAQIAASAVLLAIVITKKDQGRPWSTKMQQFTGFTLEDLVKYTIHIHEKCFIENSLVDHRDVKLQAIKQRYSEDKFYNISEVQILSYDELCSILGVDEHNFEGNELKIRFKNTKDLIMSPSRSKHRSGRTCNTEKVDADREKAATPTMEFPHDMMDYFNDSALSGYDGDKEDEGESFMDCEEYDEDLTSLWRADNTHKQDIIPTAKLEISEMSDDENSIKVNKPRVKNPSRFKPVSFSTVTMKRGTEATFTAIDVSDIPSTSQDNRVSFPGSQSGFSIYKDASQSKKNTLNVPGHGYETRSQSRLCQCGRPALRTFSNNVDNHGLNASNTTARPSSKRKTTHHIGNENKTQVMSF